MAIQMVRTTLGADDWKAEPSQTTNIFSLMASQQNQSNNNNVQIQRPQNASLNDVPDLDADFVTHCTTQLVSPETGANVYILGTAHVSTKSAEDVAKVIRFLKPDTVLVELCRSRVSMLYLTEKDLENVPDFTLSSVQEVFKQGKGFSGVLGLLLSSMYKKVHSKLKVLPGSEFKKAFEEAKALGCTVVLGDRPVEITLQRTWAKLGFFERMKLMYYIIKEGSLDITENDIEKMKNTDLLDEVVKEFAASFPSLQETLLVERDMYLAAQLRKCPGKVVVGVVGLGHVKGITNHWNAPLPDIKQLSIIPVKTASRTWSIVKKTLIGSSFLAVILYVASKYYSFKR